MEPIECLTEEDKETLLHYIYYVGEGSLDDETLPLFLSSWNAEKASLFKMFSKESGEPTLILKRHIEYDEPMSKVESRVLDVMHHYKTQMLRDDLRIAIYYHLRRLDWEPSKIASFDTQYNMLWSAEALASNIFKSTRYNKVVTTDIPTPQANRIRLSENAKTMRLIGKLARAFGYEKEYEEFRLEISQCRNTAHLEGNLCLSIHPMDYVTMSDNDCGWQSCMHWYDDGGECRIGTLDMLSSPYSVVAYLESEEPYDFCQYMFYNNTVENTVWNNKKWRQLLFVHPAFIVGNRHYPCEIPEAERIAMEWLRELAQSAGIAQYSETTAELRNFQTNNINGKSVYLSIEMTDMYNDLSVNNYYLANNFDGYLAPTCMSYHKSDYIFTTNVSGVPRCIDCGRPIYNVPDQRVLQCENCVEGFYCDCCDEFILGEPEYTNNNGQQFCYSCTDSQLTECDNCEDLYYQDDVKEFDIIAPDDEVLTYTHLCPCCVDNERYIHLFGHLINDNAFEATEVTEDGHYILRYHYRDFDEEDLLEHLVVEDEEEENE